MLITIDIFREAIWLIGRDWRVFVTVLAVPTVGYCLLGIAEDADNNSLFSLAIIFLGLVFYVVIAVTTHRLVLLGPQSVSKWALFSWAGREIKFFLYALSLMAVSFLLMMIPIPLMIPVILGFIYLIARLSLVFPSIAVEHSASLQRAWQLSDNYRWQMVLISMLYPMFLFFLIGLMLFNLEGLMVNILLNLLIILVEVITIIMVSLAYREITDRYPGF